MVLVIDNYDSFTYNLVQYLGELGVEQKVVRNDEVTAEDVGKMKPDRIVISPGPCTPKQAGISVEVVRRFYRQIPLLGVCLGHQAIGEALGGTVLKAKEIFHGKISDILHSDDPLFAGVPSPFRATRYHSLIVQRETLPSCFDVTAWTADGTIMALRHKEHPAFGVQFHPESIATPHGKQILTNFLSLR
jgi:anthranilate synthase/aminodeoxychorismate synthase-like glutamine amidotransferase